MRLTAVLAFGLAVLACAWHIPAHAAATLALCEAAQKRVSADAKLAKAVAAVFGGEPFKSRADACIYPLNAFSYPDLDVLVTAGNVPGNACHGCGAKLSAYVLHRDGDSLKLANTFKDFTEAGTFGDPGDLSPVSLGGEHGIAIESGGTFEGYTFIDLGLHLFRGGRLVHLESKPRLLVGASDEGVESDARKTTEVTGSWSIVGGGGSDIRVDYKVKSRGRTRAARTLWTVEGDAVRLKSGTVPKEALRASGG